MLGLAAAVVGIPVLLLIFGASSLLVFVLGARLLREGRKEEQL